MRERSDHYFGRLHVIVRGYRDAPQYGLLLWGWRRPHTLDVWFHHTLITFRRADPW